MAMPRVTQHDGRPPLTARMRQVIGSEWTKTRSVKSTYWLLVIAAVTALAGSVILAVSERSSTDPPPLDPVASIFLGWLEYPILAVGILGALSLASEYGNGQIRTTFAAVPQRLVVLVAKATVAGTVTLVFGEALVFASFFLTREILAGHHSAPSLSAPGVARALLAAGLGLAAIALVGLGLAAIVRSTAGAIAALPAVVYLPLAVLALPHPWNDEIGRFGLLTAAYQLVSEHRHPGLLSPALSLVVLLAWPAVTLAAGAIVIERRDA